MHLSYLVWTPGPNLLCTLPLSCDVDFQMMNSKIVRLSQSINIYSVSAQTLNPVLIGICPLLQVDSDKCCGGCSHHYEVTFH